MFGCSASGPKYGEISFERSPGLTEVYIFRLNKFVDGGSCYEINLNGESVGVLANGGFIRKEINSGDYIVSIPMINKENLDLKLTAKPNESVYIQFNVALNTSKGIPDSEIISKRSDYFYSEAALLNYNNLLVQVRPDYAIQKLESLKDSSVKRSCMATLRIKS